MRNRTILAESELLVDIFFLLQKQNIVHPGFQRELATFGMKRIFIYSLSQYSQFAFLKTHIFITYRRKTPFECSLFPYESHTVAINRINALTPIFFSEEDQLNSEMINNIVDLTSSYTELVDNLVSSSVPGRPLAVSNV